MLGGDLYSRVMLTDNDITEADIAGFVKQILSGKKLQKGTLTRFHVLYRVGIPTLIEHCSFGLKAREHCLP